MDPFTLATIGAVGGAMMNKDDPLKGAVIGGSLGFGGGTLLGPAAAGSAGAMTPVAAAPGSLKAVLPELGVQTAASMGGTTAVPGTFGAATPSLLSSTASPFALGGNQRQQLAMASNLVGNKQPQQQQMPAPQVSMSRRQPTQYPTLEEMYKMQMAQAAPRISLI